MVRWVILAVVVVALTATATLVVQYGLSSRPGWDLPAASNTKNGPQPKFEVEGALTHEFGVMTTQKTGTHTWVVRNRGQADLNLWMVSSTCLCTIAKFKDGEKAVVKPGESTEIVLEWKTKDAVGDYAKGAKIGTNDPNRPQFKLAVHGHVHNPIVVVPPERVIQVGAIGSELPRTIRAAVFSPDRPELKLTKITTSKPDLVVVKPTPLTPEDCQELKTKAGYRLDIEIKPGLSLGSFREEVVLETDHPDQPKFELTLVGTVNGPIRVMPDRLRMVTVRGKEGASGQITLLVQEGKSTQFQVAHKPEIVEVSIAPSDTPTLKGRYRLTVTIPPGTAAGLIDDQIILRTDHPKVSELKIPVNILVGAG